MSASGLESGLGQLGLWLHLRGRGAGGSGLPPVPPGAGPAIVVHVAPEADHAERQVLRRMVTLRPDLRIIRLPTPAAGLADPGDDPALMRQLLDTARPQALLLLGAGLPVALIAAAAEREIPVILAEARLDPQRSASGWNLRQALRRQMLRGMARVLVTDPASEAAALRIGVPRERLDMTGPVTDIREPLHCSEAEREALADLMDGRHAWFAAGLPPSEEQAVLAAHEAVLHHSHRALLILAPGDPGRAPALAERAEAMGMVVAQRALDEEPEPEIQVLLTEGMTEMGLWYRLAPVSYMGGTLSGDLAATRHPFEAAALGSAVVHGPRIDQHPTEWQQLDRAGAARAVSGAEGLAQAMVDLTSAELAATLAHNAWSVSTGGADVAIRIADRLFEALSQESPIP